jgi:hypothetical protein
MIFVVAYMLPKASPNAVSVTISETFMANVDDFIDRVSSVEVVDGSAIIVKQTNYDIFDMKKGGANSETHMANVDDFINRIISMKKEEPNGISEISMANVDDFIDKICTHDLIDGSDLLTIVKQVFYVIFNLKQGDIRRLKALPICWTNNVIKYALRMDASPGLISKLEGHQRNLEYDIHKYEQGHTKFEPSDEDTSSSDKSKSSTDEEEYSSGESDESQQSWGEWLVLIQKVLTVIMHILTLLTAAGLVFPSLSFFPVLEAFVSLVLMWCGS